MQRDDALESSAEAALERLTKARKFAKAGRVPEARALLQSILDDASSSGRTTVTAAKLLADLGDIPYALRALEALLDQRPDESTLRLARIDRIHLLLRLGQVSRARDALTALDKDSAPRGLTRLLLAASIARRAGRPDEAAAHLDRATCAGAYDKDSFRIDRERCEIMRVAGDPVAALTHAEALLARAPDGLGAQIMTLKAARSAGRHDLPAALVERIGARTDLTVEGWHALAEHAAFQGRMDEARALLAKAEGIWPDHPRLLVQRLKFETGQGPTEAGAQAAKTLATSQPGHNGAAVALADWFMAQDKPDAARSVLDPFLNEGTASPGLVIRLAQIVARDGDYRAEAEILRRGLALYPVNLGMVERLIRGSGAEGRAHLDAAAQQLEQNGAAPERVRRLRASVLIAANEFTAALAVHRGPGRRSPGSEDARQVALALLGLRRYALARRYLALCRRRWPDQPAIVLAYLQSLLAIGRFDDVLAQLDDHDISAMLQPDIRGARRLSALMLACRPDEAFAQYQAMDGLAGTPALLARRLCRVLVTAGRTQAAQTVARDLADSDAPITTQTLAAFEGQLLNEFALEARRGEAGAARPLPEGDRTALAQLVQDHPRSNVAAMRFVWGFARTPSEPDIGQAQTAPEPIPMRIYQYWNDVSPPDPVNLLVETWRRAPGCDHRLLDKTAALVMLRRDFGPLWAKAFLLAANAAEEADFLRLCILAQWGGIWADADDALAGPIEQLTRAGVGLVLHVERFGGSIGNNLILARPGHPILVTAARIARQALLVRSNETTWSKTGPGLLTRVVARHLAGAVLTGRSPDIWLADFDAVSDIVTMHHPLPHKRAGGHWKDSLTSLRPDAMAAALRRELVDPVEA